MRASRGNPEAVAIAFAELVCGGDTRIDATPASTGTRAARYAVPKLATQLRIPPNGAGGPGVEWDTLLAHHGWIQVTATDQTEDGASAAQRAITVTRTGHGDQGWTQQLGPFTVYLTLAPLPTQAGRPRAWAVASYNLQ